MIRTGYSGRRGDVSFPRALRHRSGCNSARRGAASTGVAVQGQQWRGWRPAGLASQPSPARSRESSLRVCPAPLRGRSALAVREWAAWCHGADAGHAAQSPTVAGMGCPYGVGATGLGRDSQAHDGAAPPCQSIKCLYPRAGTGVHVRGLRARRSPLEGAANLRARRNPVEGGVYPRARRSLLEGTFEWAALVGRGDHCSVGRGDHRSVGRAPCVRLSEMRLALVFCRF
jgi:hypothetical protein